MFCLVFFLQKQHMNVFKHIHLHLGSSCCVEDFKYKLSNICPQQICKYFTMDLPDLNAYMEKPFYK